MRRTLLALGLAALPAYPIALHSVMSVASETPAESREEQEARIIKLVASQKGMGDSSSPADTTTEAKLLIEQLRLIQRLNCFDDVTARELARVALQNVEALRLTSELATECDEAKPSFGTSVEAAPSLADFQPKLSAFAVYDFPTKLLGFQFQYNPRITLNLNSTKGDSTAVIELAKTGDIDNQFEPLALSAQYPIPRTPARFFAAVSPTWNLMSVSRQDSVVYSGYSFYSFDFSVGAYAVLSNNTKMHFTISWEHYLDDDNEALELVSRKTFRRLALGVELIDQVSIEIRSNNSGLDLKKNTEIRIGYSVDTKN